jgi:hypothetical protein
MGLFFGIQSNLLCRPGVWSNLSAVFSLPFSLVMACSLCLSLSNGFSQVAALLALQLFINGSFNLVKAVLVSPPIIIFRSVFRSVAR